LELKKYGKEDTTIGDYTLWRNVDKYQESLANASQAQKILSPDENDGYWELYDITCSDLPTIQVDPLLQTKWGQFKPWNTCVPTGYNTTDRCATGCVAVAGAQTLHYLHYDIGIPAYIPTVGSCVGYSNSSTDKNYNFYFSNQTSTAWNNMARTYWDNSRSFDQSAILMGWVGMNLNMNYTLNESYIETKDLVQVFNSIGINCTYKDYNSKEVRQSLENRTPVILRAKRRTEPIVVLWITWGYKYSGHSFVADGYETRQTKYTYHYQWVYGNGMQPMYLKSQKTPTTDESFKTEEYISTSNLLIMNWGFDGDYDNGRYTYDGAWNTSSDRNYAYDRSMIIGFSKK